MDNRRRAYLRILGAAAILALVAPAAATAQPAVTILHSFAADGTDGMNPQASLIQATDGNFYGTSFAGGVNGAGTVFTMTPGGTVTILHAFGAGTDGANPYASLIQATDGNFYGTTGYGGASGQGTVFTMTPAGTVTVLHAFDSGTDGAYPQASLIQATDGNFYGTTAFGPPGTLGTVFSMTPAGTVVILHAFAGGTDGAYPAAPLIQAADGNFYGTTVVGGAADDGTIFKMTPAGVVTILYPFAGGTDGAYPYASLLQAADGNFYGTTAGLGVSDSPDGTVFKMTPAGTFTTLHAFAGGTDGNDPNASLVQSTDGIFYGTSVTGGGITSDACPNGCGTIFKMTPAGSLTVLYAFTGGTDGSTLDASLIQATDGNLYGTTYAGGNSGAGAVFELAGPPTITTQPRSQTLASGQTATLSVVASGSGLIYQWYIGTTGTTTSPIAGATASSYTTPVLTSRTSYWVRVSNSTATADSNTATVITAIVPVDFDGDGKADISVYRPSTGTWFTLNSRTSYTTSNSHQWGGTGDIPVPGDYDGDGKADVAVYRPATGTWYVLQSSTGYATSFAVQWGGSGDIPVPGDYDGDGQTDIAVYRPSTGTWYVLQSTKGYSTAVAVQWGGAADVPVPGDYDGDGKTDVAVYRPSTGTWYALRSSTGNTTSLAFQWGSIGDIPVPGDYDGDGRTDLTVYRPSTGTWYSRLSTTNYSTYTALQWGGSGDVPVPADYDGDGKADPAVYRHSTGMWYVLKSSTNYTMSNGYQWGSPSGDVPITEGP